MANSVTDAFMTLDALDRRILRAVQARATLSSEELAVSCGTSPSTALRRLSAMRQNKIITGEVAIINSAAVGRGLILILGVRLEGENDREASEFIARIAAHVCVMQFYFVTGTKDYVIIINARTMAEYDDFVKSELVGNPRVFLSETNVVIRPLKMSLAVPIDEPT